VATDDDAALALCDAALEAKWDGWVEAQCFADDGVEEREPTEDGGRDIKWRAAMREGSLAELSFQLLPDAPVLRFVEFLQESNERIKGCIDTGPEVVHAVAEDVLKRWHRRSWPVLDEMPVHPLHRAGPDRRASMLESQESGATELVCMRPKL
jgi:hypothetical protein